MQHAIYRNTVQSSPAGAKRILFRSTMMQKKWSKISIHLMYQCVIIFNYSILQVGRKFQIWGSFTNCIFAQK